MKLSTDEIAVATGGRVVGAATVVDGAEIDSRELVPGRLFVPIVAERDGHDFIGSAVERGATAYLSDREPDPSIDATAVVVDDTADALTAIGALARDRIGRDPAHQVVGITGSVGKTSVKDLTTGAVGARLRAACNPASFNNELGVPLTLANAPDDTQVMVVEMGARGVGHIAELCAIAHPTIGVVTTVGAVHTEGFGGLDAVIATKGELIEALPSSGTAVLNAEVPPVLAMAARTDAPVVSFGEGGDVRAEQIRIGDDLVPRFRLVSEWGKADVALAVRGAHNVSNALAAAAVALVCGVSPDAVAEGLADVSLSRWRMEVSTAPSGATIINDAYNANPISVRSALESLAAVEADRRVAVLGVMAELGAEHDRGHRQMGELAASLGVSLITVDAPAYGGAGVGAVEVADLDAAAAAIETLADGRPIGAGDAVLVKGSRVAGLERLAARLLA